MLAVVLALSASVSWGIADFVAAIQSRRLPVFVVLLVSQAAGLAAIALVVAARGDGPPGAADLAYGALGGIAGVAALAAFYRGMSVGAMAVVAPIAATSAGVPVAVGIATGERPSALQLAGMLAALAGVALAAREAPAPGAARARLAAGASYALVSVLGFGLFFLAMDRASESDVLWATLANRVASVSLLALGALALRPPLRRARPALRELVAVGLLDVSANTLFALATTQGYVSLAAVLASLYPVVVIALARALLGERVGRAQAVGAAVALAGVALISSG